MENNIYTYILKNFNIEIKDYQFKRDYIKEPLQKQGKYKKLELPHKEDLEYLYIHLNIRAKDICKMLNTNTTTFSKILNIYGLFKPLELIINNSVASSIGKNNGHHLFQTDDYKNNYTRKPKTTKWKENQKKNNLKKYGVENVFQLESVKCKSKQTCLKKHGVEYFTQCNKYKSIISKNKNIINNKIYKTKKNNGTLGKNISNEESKIFNKLISIYPNVITQHYSELYPYKCDFYIPEIDTYIEYNGFWTHGKEPYIGTNEQIDIVKLWENKSNDCQRDNKHNQYKRAIDTWTKSDVEKRNTAKQNNLNYIEFFTIDEFNEWFKGIKTENNIYDYIIKNFNIEIKDYQFKRDYIKEPIIKQKQGNGKGLMYEPINKDDLKYLYISLNLSIKQCSSLFNISESAVKHQLNQNNIKKIKTNPINNLSINVSQLSRDYVKLPLNVIQNGSVRIIEKPCQNDLEELYINQNLSVEDIHNYLGVGVQYLSNLLKEYNITKNNAQQYKRRKKKLLATKGVENVFQLDSVKEKAIETRRKKYKCDYFSQTNEYKQYIKTIQNSIQIKQLITKTKNGTLGKSLSSEENNIYKKLMETFNDVKRQHYSELYPYKCDFYIPEIDTYIEYNGFWMHGKEPYIGTNEQIDIVKLWENKNTPQYLRAINTWTKSDVEKRNTAKQNNLNYIEFFTIDEFNRWFEGIKNPSN